MRSAVHQFLLNRLYWIDLCRRMTDHKMVPPIIYQLPDVHPVEQHNYPEHHKPNLHFTYCSLGKLNALSRCRCLQCLPRLLVLFGAAMMTL
jgi:hypothetical protein